MKNQTWKTSTHVVKTGKEHVVKKSVDWTNERTCRVNSGTVSARVSYRNIVNMLKK